MYLPSLPSYICVIWLSEMQTQNLNTIFINDKLHELCVLIADTGSDSFKDGTLFKDGIYLFLFSKLVLLEFV